MSQANKTEYGQTVLSDEAVDVLLCFDRTLGEIVLQLAESIARQRYPGEDRIRIDEEDIRRAGEQLLDSVKKMDNMPVELKLAVEEARGCLESKRTGECR